MSAATANGTVPIYELMNKGEALLVESEVALTKMQYRLADLRVRQAQAYIDLASARMTGRQRA